MPIIVEFYTDHSHLVWKKTIPSRYEGRAMVDVVDAYIKEHRDRWVFMQTTPYGRAYYRRMDEGTVEATLGGVHVIFNLEDLPIVPDGLEEEQERAMAQARADFASQPQSREKWDLFF